MKLTYEDIYSGILSIKDEQSLHNLNQLLVERIRDFSSLKEAKLRFSFVSGQKVTFKGRRGITEKGTIESMGPKKAVVRTGEFTSWRVPYSMLKAV